MSHYGAIRRGQGQGQGSGQAEFSSPVIAAAGVGNTAAAKLLLERGAKPDAYAGGVGQKTVTPLLGAAHNGDVELTRLLLARKPDLDTKSPDNDGIVKNGPVAFGKLTALHLATAAPSADGSRCFSTRAPRSMCGTRAVLRR